MSNNNAALAEPWLHAWPKEGLETVTLCPVCQSQHRAKLCDGVVDNIFFCAAGTWTLWKCANCSSGYLSPRPTPASIHLAYESYYTHAEAVAKQDYAGLSTWRKLRRCLVNGYVRWRYGTPMTPRSGLGVLAMHMLWPARERLDREYRHLPRVPAGGGTVLDVGCGNGLFLEVARSCGWDVVGVDPDLKATTHCVQRGLNVIHGGIEQFDSMENKFDVITLNHVIEHLYDPVTVLEKCHQLLKPGGQLWLETPNVSSLGLKLFNKSWRGLETPRHLVLFNHASLRTTLTSLGFLHLQSSFWPCAVHSLWSASIAVANGRSPHQAHQISWRWRLKIFVAGLIEVLAPSQKELISFRCHKQPHKNSTRP